MIGILGLGAYVPERVMSNEEWGEWVETSDEWITARTGIKRRRIADESESTLDLAHAAAVAALEDSGTAVEELDEIILATDTPEVYLPDTSSLLQDRLGAREISTFDLAGSGCAGWVLALDVALSRVRAGKEKVLVVGSELLSRLMNWRDRNTCVLFGDAAGAAVVGRGDRAIEVLASTAGTDGSAAGILGLEAGGTRIPFSLEAAQAGLHKKIVMQGREVFKHAVRRMSAAARKVLDEAGLTIEDVDLVVPHQANMRIIDAVGRALGVAREKVYINVEEYGNTGSASVPLALWEARGCGRVREGDKVLLTAFGAGFHWAAMVLAF